MRPRALLLLFVSSPVFAQGTGAVAGRVTDSDGRPLGGVVVALPSLGRSVSTRATGRYVLSGVPAGRQVLQFSRIGYAASASTVAVAADTTFTLDAVLIAQPVRLGTLMVEAPSRSPDRVIDAPAAVDVVRPNAAQSTSITGQIPLALARVPGLDVVQNGVNDFNVNARGFNSAFSRKMLVLQDGRDLASVVSVRQSWGALAEPLEDFERIEIIRGPGSALYGPNAYNGVISLTTPAARDIVGTKLSLGGGELSTLRADLRHAGVWFHGRLGYRVNIGYRRSADWAQSRTARDGSDWKAEYAPATDAPPTSPRPDSLPLVGQTKDPVTGRALGTPDHVASRYGSARADYYAPGGSIVTLEGGVAREDNAVYISNRARTQIPRFLRPWARLAWNAGGTELSAWYSGFSLQGGLVSLTSGAPSYNDEAVFHLEGHTSFRFAGNAGRGVVGASAQDNAVNTKGTLLGLASDDRSDQYYGAFAQMEYAVGRVRMIGATRWDDSNLFPTQLSPKVGVVFAPTANHALRLTINRAFLTPGMGSLFLAASAGPGVENLLATENQLRADPAVGPALASVPLGKLFNNSVAVPESALGNPRLRPQTVTSYEAGYKGQLGQRFFVALDVYRARMRDFLTDQLPAGTTGVNPDFQPWTAPPEVPAANRAQVEAAVLTALAARGSRIRNGLTRLADGTTAVVLSWGNAGVVDEWGVELGSSLSLANAWTVGASYSWFDSAVRENTTALNVLTPNTPDHKGTATLEYAGRQGIRVAVDARIVAGYHWTSGIWDGDVPASQTVNLDASYRFTSHLSTYLIATNLLDQRRFQFYGASVIGRRVLAGMTARF